MVDLFSQPVIKIERMPPLENGDKLTRHEFERRYHAAPHVKKAELIEGIVYVASPLRFESHAEPHGNLIIWMGTYKTFTRGVRMGIEPTVRLDEDNEPQPDGVLWLPAAAGGKVTVAADDYLEGAPELVMEVAASSAAIDLNTKMHAYRRNGVQEYIVWQVFENQVRWFTLQQGEYVPLEADADGIVKSRVFPGLWLAIAALLQGEMQAVLTVLQTGIQSADHQTFVECLSSPST
jgi:Uma2 family endonuclease